MLFDLDSSGYFLLDFSFEVMHIPWTQSLLQLVSGNYSEIVLHFMPQIVYFFFWLLHVLRAFLIILLGASTGVNNPFESR